MKPFLSVLPFWIILCLVFTPAAYGAPSDDFKTGVDFFRAGDFEHAYETFKRVFEATPSDPEVNFYLGRAAFEGGDYEAAVMAFDRVLIVNPSANRVKLEMARAYQKLGVNSMARKYCNEVLQSGPPLAVVENIKKFLAFMDRAEQRHFINGSISMGLNFNDNVFASPLNRTIETILGDVVLAGDTAEETADHIYSTAAELSHAYKIGGSGTLWKTSTAVYDAKYKDEDALDTLFLEGTTGPEWLLGRYRAGFEILANHLSLDGSSYQNAYGISGIFGYQANPGFGIEGQLTVEKKDYDTSVRDTNRVALSWKVIFPVFSVWCDAGAGAERWDADSNEYSFNRYSGEVTLRHQPAYGIAVSGNYEFRYSDYDGNFALFGKDRQDRVHYVMAGIEKCIWQRSNSRGQLMVNLNYLHTVADSSIDLYEYRKNEVFSSLTYRF